MRCFFHRSMSFQTHCARVLAFPRYFNLRQIVVAARLLILYVAATKTRDQEKMLCSEAQSFLRFVASLTEGSKD